MADIRSSRISRTDRPSLQALQSMDSAGNYSPHGRTSVISRKISTVETDKNFPNLKRVILGRPARVFWDLENCSVGGKDYFPDIMRTIQSRVEADTGQDCFEIYAAYDHASHIHNDIYSELVAYDVNFNLIDPNGGSKTPVEDDLYEQIEKFLGTQCQQTHLFPYILLISGSVNMISKMEKLEKCSKIVYAVRKEKDQKDISFGGRLSNHVIYEYTITKGIQARIN